MKKRMLFQYPLIGIGFGSTTFLVFLALDQLSRVNQSEIISTFIMSALIGELTLLFSLPRLAFLPALLIHYGCTLLLVYLFGWYNNWIFNLFWYWVQVTLVYLVIWGYQFLFTLQKTNEINQLIQKRKHQR